MSIANLKLSQLRPGGPAINARRGDVEGIAELAASIKAVGLLQPLIVRASRDDGPEFAVIDGNRRLAALQKLHKKADIEVPVIVRDEAATPAYEASLAANVVRLAMHPVDEYGAYQAMIDAGSTPETVAARFGVKVKWVRQRLQLAALAFDLREAWRAGKMTADQAEALSSVPDHARQLKVWKVATRDKNNEYSGRPDALRRQMREEGVGADDSDVKFIGLDAYLERGGRMTEDLFADDRLLLDEELIDTLVAEKLAPVCAKFVAEGWAWAEPGDGWRGVKLDVEPWMTPQERAVMTGKDWNAKIDARDNAEKRAIADPAARAKSGVVVSLSYEGDVEAKFLLVKKTDADDGDAEGDAEAEGGPSPASATTPAAETEEAAPAVNFALREALSETMTVALSKALASNPDVALAAIAATLRVGLESFTASPLRISTADAWKGLAGSDRSNDLNWATEFEIALDLSIHEQLNRLAAFVSCVVDVRHLKFDNRASRGWDDRRDEFVDALAGALNPADVRLEIAAAFDAEAYFKRVNAAMCVEALVDMNGPGVAKGGKKAVLAARAVALAKTTGWLPAELRTVHYEGPTGARKEAAE